MTGVVIVGTGLAGYTVARELRKLDAQTPLTLVSADAGSFYSKPMLSNALALGKTPASLPTADAARMAETLHAEVLTGTRVDYVDTGARRVHCGARSLGYAALVLAVGAEPIRLELAGDGARDVFAVNNLADYARLRAALEGARRVAILGPGLIGCEFANDLVAAGFEVAVAGPDAAPLGRLVPDAVGRALERGLAGAGVAWHLGVLPEAVDRMGRVLRLRLSDGAVIEADVVLSAVGLRPATALAEAAGLPVGRGIRVDRRLASSVPGVYAIGDCADLEGLVMPYVMPIMHGARALAQTLAGTPTPVRYPAMPVVVKTPACPVVVCPPAPDASGEWSVEAAADGVRARFLGPDERLLGFALAGGATAEKQSLARALPPVLA